MIKNEQEYRAALAAHDWYYGYSDDHAVFKRGQESKLRLNAAQQKFDPDFAIWNSIAPTDCQIPRVKV